MLGFSTSNLNLKLLIRSNINSVFPTPSFRILPFQQPSKGSPIPLIETNIIDTLCNNSFSLSLGFSQLCKKTNIRLFTLSSLGSPVSQSRRGNTTSLTTSTNIIALFNHSQKLLLKNRLFNESWRLPPLNHIPLFNLIIIISHKNHNTLNNPSTINKATPTMTPV